MHLVPSAIFRLGPTSRRSCLGAPTEDSLTIKLLRLRRLELSMHASMQACSNTTSILFNWTHNCSPQYNCTI
ncbi:hypothetical protein DUNSADRAFT_3424 [Dunaliella salina]|uniref:Encoded protein n=1 Tax=Dunaliella salina TaxID=3046 RepID=A0ABQ7FVE6_DUNSA|nr:hypothetical protein DUNSADRAFT_3424 [Dunaliella salina]|eukprot:KAF5826357.1 hypothetical protein DUNSADRAFT_3424 [Dunaliella salina]